MKKTKKILLSIYTMMTVLLYNVMLVSAEVKFNTGEANKVKSNILTPATAWFMGIVGGVAILACAIQYVRWALKDEEEREQKGYWKSIKPIVIGLIVVESLSTILLIFSIVA